MSFKESKITASHQTSDQEQATQALVPMDTTSESLVPDHKDNNADVVSSSTRLRTYTDKGHKYQLDLLRRRLSSTTTRIKRQCSLIDELLQTTNIELVQSFKQPFW